MLISDEYRATQKQLHENPNYGVASIAYAPLVARMMQEYGVDEILDYGAGKLRLKEELDNHGIPNKYHAYEPSNPLYSDPPKPAQCVTCIDVLEHVEPECIEDVLDHIHSLALEYAFLTVHTKAAQKVLPDGRNAHLIQEPSTWWIPKIASRMEIIKFIDMEEGFVVFCRNGRDNPRLHRL